MSLFRAETEKYEIACFSEVTTLSLWPREQTLRSEMN